MSILSRRGCSTVTGIESLEDTRIRLADERKKRKYPFKEMKEINDISNDQLSLSLVSVSDPVDSVLRYLKSQEPNSDNLFFRLAIIEYEWGDLNRAIVYSERFCNDETMFKVGDDKKVMFRDGFKDKKVILSEGKLAMADMLTQLYLLTLSLGWDWEELRKLGANHLEERHKDFKRDGWKEVKK